LISSGDSYRNALPGGVVYPQRKNLGGDSRYVRHVPIDPHDERHLRYKGNQHPDAISMTDFDSSDVTIPEPWNESMIPDPKGERIVDANMYRVGPLVSIIPLCGFCVPCS